MVTTTALIVIPFFLALTYPLSNALWVFQIVATLSSGKLTKDTLPNPLLLSIILFDTGGILYLLNMSQSIRLYIFGDILTALGLTGFWLAIISVTRKGSKVHSLPMMLGAEYLLVTRWRQADGTVIEDDLWKWYSRTSYIMIFLTAILGAGWPRLSLALPWKGFGSIVSGIKCIKWPSFGGLGMLNATTWYIRAQWGQTWKRIAVINPFILGALHDINPFRNSDQLSQSPVWHGAKTDLLSLFLEAIFLKISLNIALHYEMNFCGMDSSLNTSGKVVFLASGITGAILGGGHVVFQGYRYVYLGGVILTSGFLYLIYLALSFHFLPLTLALYRALVGVALGFSSQIALVQPSNDEPIDEDRFKTLIIWVQLLGSLLGTAIGQSVTGPTALSSYTITSDFPPRMISASISDGITREMAFLVDIGTYEVCFMIGGFGAVFTCLLAGFFRGGKITVS